MARRSKRRKRAKERKRRRRGAWMGYIKNEDGVIQIDSLRRLLGGAIKYILPEEHWDFSGEIEPYRTLDATVFSDESLAPMVERFCSQSTKEMRESSELTECMKALVQYSDGLANPRCKTRTRKKRISRLREEFFKILRDHRNPDPMKDSTRRKVRGVRFFSASIKKQFLGEEKS